MDDRRYYGLDALRGAMMMLGIVLHAASFYLAAPPPHLPVTTDRNTSYAMDLIVNFIHGFRMPTFFVLAGFFAALLVEKRGLAGTYRNRAARILAPLVAGMFTVLPLSMLFFVDFVLSVQYGTRDLLPERALVEALVRDAAAQGIPDDLFLAHLWFLYYLCFFYLLIPLCRLLLKWSEPAAGRIRRFLASPAALAVLSLYTAATLWPYRGGQVFGEFLFLTPHPPSLVFYGSFFVLGYLFHAHRGFLQDLARQVPWYAVLATVSFPLSLWASHLEYTDPTQGFASHFVAVVAHGFCTWTLVCLAIGCALRYFDRPSPWILYVSQSSYWVFLVHLPIVTFAAWWLVPHELPALLKFTIVAGVTTVACFLSYHYLVQRSWVSDFLNGRRFDLDWPWRKRAPGVEAAA